MGVCHDDIHDADHDYKPLPKTTIRKLILIFFLLNLGEYGAYCTCKGFPCSFPPSSWVLESAVFYFRVFPYHKLLDYGESIFHDEVTNGKFSCSCSWSARLILWELQVFPFIVDSSAYPYFP